MKKTRVAVAMSGGVDSSVAAFLLKEKGFDVFGITMLIRRNENDIVDARRIASQLKIPFQTINLVKEFKNNVIDYFCGEYLRGATPNPCIICNEKIKFGYLLDYAKTLGMDYIATGHYAKNYFNKEANRFAIKKGKDRTKDQSYVLFPLTQNQLKHIIFPLSDLTKEEVRKIAKENGLITAKKKESQEICFIPDNDYPKFISQNPPIFPFGKGGLKGDLTEGLILDIDGKILGRHKGIYHYTIGQRKGLGIASPYPLYVLKIDVKKNEILVGKDEDLYQKEFIAENVNWQAIDELKKPISVKTKIRYKFEEEKAKVFPVDGKKARVEFLKPQRAITPGQAVVFYKRDMVVGGGWIAEAESEGFRHSRAGGNPVIQRP
ncbi:MAG: tRNA 2-thiouridine(34) synthase MnmA [bacterium]